jgi:hypothetical protein
MILGKSGTFQGASKKCDERNGNTTVGCHYVARINTTCKIVATPTFT